MQNFRENHGYLNLSIWLFIAALVFFFSGNFIKDSENPELVELRSFFYVISSSLIVMSVLSLSCYGVVTCRNQEGAILGPMN